MLSDEQSITVGFPGAGLSGLVRQHISHELMSGKVFIFVNRRRDRIKLMIWDATGFALYCKQLEQGAFSPHTQWQGCWRTYGGILPLASVFDPIPGVPQLYNTAPWGWKRWGAAPAICFFRVPG